MAQGYSNTQRRARRLKGAERRVAAEHAAITRERQRVVPNAFPEIEMIRSIPGIKKSLGHADVAILIDVIGPLKSECAQNDKRQINN